MSDISKITLPSGNSYDIKDAAGRTQEETDIKLLAQLSLDKALSTYSGAITAINTYISGSKDTFSNRLDAVEQAVSGGISFISPWQQADYTSTTAPTAAKLATVPAVTVYYNNGANSATGTLTAASAQPGAFYLLYSKTQAGDHDVYDEYVSVLPSGASTKVWEKIGDTGIVSISLTKDSAIKTGKVTIPSKTVSPTGGASDKVLGVDTTFTNAASSVSFATHTTDKVLGEATTFSSSVTIPTVSKTSANIHAAATGTTVGANGTVDVKTYTANTNNLVTTSITPVGSSTVTATNTVFGTNTTASKATAGTAVTVAKKGTSTSVGSGGTSNSTTNTDILKGVSVSGETLSIGACTLGTKSIIPAADTTETITPYTFADVTVPVVTSNAQVTAATKGTAVTVATGSLDATGTGDSVATGISGTSAGTALTGVKVTAQPTITLTTPTGTTASTDINMVKEVTIGSTTASPSITVGTNDKVSAITALGAATAAAQAITVGTNDNVTALTSAGSATIASYDVNVTATATIQAVTDATLG